MTHLFNGILQQKFKTPLPDQSGALKAIARRGAKDSKLYDIEVDESMIPMPSVLLQHELDNDIMLQDTILSLCDKDGMPLKWKYLANDMEDVMELVQSEPFFEQIPMCEDYYYHVARDWVGCPINKYEIDSIARQRKVFEKRALKKRQEYERKQKQNKSHAKKNIQVTNEKRKIIF